MDYNNLLIATILDAPSAPAAMPGMTRFGVAGTARASFAAYNDDADVDALIEGMRSVQRIFG